MAAPIDAVFEMLQGARHDDTTRAEGDGLAVSNQ